MGLSCTVSMINGDFNRTSQNFLTHPVYFALPLTGFPLELGKDTLRVVTANTGWFVRLFRHNIRTPETDGQTETISPFLTHDDNKISIASYGRD